MTNQEIIAVVQAAEREELIQFVHKGFDDWQDVGAPSWDFLHCEYRVKPALVEGWVNVYPEGDGHRIHKSKDRADACYLNSRIRCVHVREVEE